LVPKNHRKAIDPAARIPIRRKRDEWGSHISYDACEIKILTEGGATPDYEERKQYEKAIKDRLEAG